MKERENQIDNETITQRHMSIYPYWLMYPEGWNYPAACATGSASKGGWSASVDLQSGNILSEANLMMQLFREMRAEQLALGASVEVVLSEIMRI